MSVGKTPIEVAGCGSVCRPQSVIAALWAMGILVGALAMGVSGGGLMGAIVAMAIVGVILVYMSTEELGVDRRLHGLCSRFRSRSFFSIVSFA